MVSSYQQDWSRIQDELKENLVTEDDFTWTLPKYSSGQDERVAEEKLRYIGGVDVSFSKVNTSLACGALVVLDACTLEVVYEDYEVVHLDIPYVPGFLAFREAPVLLGILEKMKRAAQSYYPQLLMVDGNGLLHPRVSLMKQLHHVDGLTESGVRKLLEERKHCESDIIPLTGKSGKVWGMALHSTKESSKPIYISTGHRISLDSSVKVVRACCKFRVPEPIRLADIKSREYIQKLHGS